MASGHGAFFTVAEEKIASAGGAEIADEDILRAEAGFEELRTIGFAQIEQNVFRWRLVAGGHHVEPLQRIWFVAGAQFVEPAGSIGELRLELDSDFGANFVTATANGGAESGEQVRGLRAELHLHLPNCFRDDTLKRAAPSGMHGGDGALFRVNKKNGDTVRSLDAKKQAGAIGR